jgi:hypothetical protein
MPKKPKNEVPKLEPLELISRLLALHLVKDMENTEAAARLGAVGFDDKSVGEMVGITESTVRGIRFRRSKKPAKKKNNSAR